MTTIEAIPQNPYNEKLIENVAPQTWVNPTPSGKYNIVIIGGGSAGLVIASGAAGLGAKVALIEKNMLGGDCLNVGCVPSKAIIRSAKIFGDLKVAKKLGVNVPEGVSVDFKQVMERVWKVRSDIAPHDSAHRYTELGVDVYFGSAEFTSPSTIKIGDTTLEFSKAAIATGSRPLEIPFKGIKEVGYLTNETLWNITEQPTSLAVIGAGPIGVELAQSFQRLGTQVTLVDIADQILPREDRDAAEIVEKALIEDGLQLCLSANTKEVTVENGKKVLHIERNGEALKVIVDEILMAVGRTPNVEGLGLEVAGVDYHRKGVTVDDNLRTTNPNIFAAGDVSMKYQFTHAAGHAAAIVIQNALFPGPKRKLSDLIMPWATYSDPEIAHVGMYEKDATDAGIEVDTYHVSMSGNDRAIADGEEEGFVKIHTKKGGDEILGATIVARHAGEMISEITLAMKNKIGLGKISGVIHPYPTQAEAIHRAAGEYMKSRLKPSFKKVLTRYMAYSRK